MDKIAELVRDSEIRGAVAAFVDAGLVKVASVEAFDDLAETVANVIGDEDYDIQKVAAVTDYVVAYDAEQQRKAMRKTARMKKKANALTEAFGRAGKAVSRKARAVADVVFGRNVRRATNAVKDNEAALASKKLSGGEMVERNLLDESLKSDLAKEKAKTYAARAAAAAGTLGTAYGVYRGGKALYDKVTG